VTSPEHEPSPLGRYDDSGGDEPLHEVRLLNVPVRIHAASRQHHDELMHEFAVLAVALEDRESVPSRMLALIDTLGTKYAGSSDRPDAEIDAALARGDDGVDLVFHVPEHVLEAADRLQALMDEADRFCRAEQMLTLERTAAMQEFAVWYLDEFRHQIAGEQPRAWTGPMDP
jgi:hypothetical protein